MNDFLKNYPSILVIGIVLLLCMAPAVQSKEFIPPVSEFSTNYYETYGEPDIYASVVGDVEIGRGEEYLLNVVLSNRGVLHGVEYDTSIDADETEHALSLKELEYEAYRTTAIGLKAELISTSDYIDVDPDSSLQTLDELMPGVLPDYPLVFKLEVSEHAPAGEYLLLLPVTYQYQSEVEMTGGSTVILGLPSMDHTTYYKNANKTLQIPILVKPDPKLEVTEVEGELMAGSTSTVNITYTNMGEMPANDAIARLVAMKPLSSSRNEISLGTLYPGEKRTVSFEVTAENNAVPKDYAISSEVKYIDEDGETSLSDALMVQIPLHKSESVIPTFDLLLAGVFLIVGFMSFRYVRKN
ncbi:hypothetical protein J2755_001360 [Methanohalophilus levihalophilus]|uniref:COG1361 S-layer family protein n=1 Tax=Methanohalophilus levihalophilus TaxID=1431282 RepID=UPI001AEA74EE|nr:hypothetical protein [Methanohalophilus levihalophilus]MBP2030426.1 hypothetical protein [Methanohalophilus levihalophilus]